MFTKGRCSKASMFLAILFLMSCDEVADAVREERYKGTNLGVASCIERNSESGLTKDLVRRLCFKKHERVLSGVNISGGASYTGLFERATVFSGTITNASDNAVVTGLEIFVQHKDNSGADGRPIVERCTIDGMEVPPRKFEAFRCPELKFLPRMDRLRDDKGSLSEWNIGEVRGVSIELR